MNLILLYKYVKIDGMEDNEAISTIGYASSELKKVKAAFNALCKVLDKYDFKRN